MNSCVFVLATEDFLCAARQSSGQLLALVYDTDRLLPEPCCFRKRQAVAGTWETLHGCGDLQGILGLKKYFCHTVYEKCVI